MLLVLLLPALSSISTRGEMRPLMERLASQFRRRLKRTAVDRAQLNVRSLVHPSHPHTRVRQGNP
jgi:hypothetical protein